MGNSLPKPILEKVRLHGELPAIKAEWAVSSMQGWSVHMEDKFSVVEKLESDSHLFDGYTYFGVFDGHGGSKASEAVSHLLVKDIVKCAEQYVASQHGNEKPNSHRGEETVILGMRQHKVLSNEDITKCLIEGYLNFDHYLFDNRKELLKKEKKVDEESKQEGKEPEEHERRENYDGQVQDDVERSGSTAVCALVSDKQIFIANCGDSRAIIVDGDKPIFGTKDHKPTLPEERERILAGNGIVMNKRVNGVLAVSRSLGDFDYKAEPELPFEKQAVSPMPDVTVHELSGQERFIILACDGVWDVMTNEELVDYIRYVIQMRKEYTIQEICDIVIDTCLQKGSADNLTVIIIAFRDRLPTYNEDLVRRDAELDILLQQKADEILAVRGRMRPIESLSDLMYSLKEQDIQGLPPGAGLSAKRKLMEVKFQEWMAKEKERKAKEAEEDAARETAREAARQEAALQQTNEDEDKVKNANGGSDHNDDYLLHRQIYKRQDFPKNDTNQ